MSDRPPVVDRPHRNVCPTDAELQDFDRGKLPSSQAEVLSDHVAGCQRCHRLLTDQPYDDTRLMAELLTPGKILLAEPEYQKVRQTMLQQPEAISAQQLEVAETSLSLGHLVGDEQVPSQIGAYRLRHILGRGAMGAVYRARHVNLKRDAALKILHPQLIPDHEIVQRFYGEMEALGQLRDPHIVQAYDAGESSGAHFLAMEYVDGADAATLCARAGRLPVSDACEIVRQTALGLETARRHNMVHRDIKPSNLMVGRTGQVKILDLGLASFRQEGIDRCGDDSAVGTVDYMAPEQWKGSPQIDIRADIYSLGCTLYKLLTGRPPFHDAPDDGMSKMQAHLSQPVPSVREARRDVPRELESLVSRMLQKKPAHRWTTPQEVAEAIEPFGQSHDLAGLVERCVPAVTGDTAVHTDTLATGRSTTTGARRRRRRTVWVTAASFLLVLLSAIVIRVTDKGTVLVTVDHPDAKIEVAGVSKVTGQAGVAVPFQLRSGTHKVTVTKDGFDPRVTKIEIGRWDEKPLDIKLTPQDSGPPVPEYPIRLLGHKGPLAAVDISSDGKWILTASMDRTIRVWNALTGEEHHQLLGHEDAVLDAAFGHDDQHAISASKDLTARRWDVETGAEIQRFGPHKDAVMCVAISRDGTRLLTGSKDGMVRMWDVSSGQQLAMLAGHRGWVRDVSFLPDARYAISCGNDRVAILWDLESGQMQHVLQGHTGNVNSVSPCRDGQHVVTGSGDGTIRLWNVHTEQQQNTLPLYGAAARRVRFFADANYVISASGHYDLMVWNPFTGRCLTELSGEGGRVTGVAVNVRAGLIASASADRSAQIWKLPALEEDANSQGPTQPPLAPVLGESAILVKPDRTWSASQAPLQSLAVAPDGQSLATGGDDGIVRIWTPETEELRRELTAPTGGILCLRFSPDGTWLAAGAKDRQIYVWNMVDPGPPSIFAGHQGWVTSLSFSSDSQRLLSGSFDTAIRVWEVESGKVLRNLPGRVEWIRSVIYGRNKRAALTLSAGNAGCLRFWVMNRDLPTPLSRFLGAPYQTNAIASMALSPDGRLVAAGGWDEQVRVWNTVMVRPVSQFPCTAGPVYDLVWYGDARRLLTACADGTLRLWNMRSGSELKRYVGHRSAVRGVSLSADRRIVASVDVDGAVCLWPPESTDKAAGEPADTNPTARVGN